MSLQKFELIVKFENSCDLRRFPIFWVKSSFQENSCQIVYNNFFCQLLISVRALVDYFFHQMTNNKTRCSKEDKSLAVLIKPALSSLICAMFFSCSFPFILRWSNRNSTLKTIWGVKRIQTTILLSVVKICNSFFNQQKLTRIRQTIQYSVSLLEVEPPDHNLFDALFQLKRLPKIDRAKTFCVVIPFSAYNYDTRFWAKKTHCQVQCSFFSQCLWKLWIFVFLK